MALIKIKRITGSVSALDFCMQLAIVLLITVLALLAYGSATKTRINPSLLNIAILSDHLTYSTSDKDMIILNYHEIVPFQESLFSKIDCYKYSCELFDINKYNENTYLKIFYKNSHLSAFSIYTKEKESIFEFNKTPYLSWFKDFDNNEFIKQQIENTKLEKNRNDQKNNHLYTFLKTMTIYPESDNGQRLYGHDCHEKTCSVVLNYKLN